MTTNQEGVHAAIRASTGTARSYNEDWHAIFNAAGIATGNFDSRMLAWVNARLSTSYTNVNTAMNAFAISQGFTNWSAMNTLTLGFSPDQLFTGGYLGDWWSTSDLTKLKQDSAETTAVAADNDPVGSWRGKVNNTQLLQATAGARPLYKSSNATIIADGVDDSLVSASNFSFSGYPLSLVAIFDQSATFGSQNCVAVSAGLADYRGISINNTPFSRAVDQAAAAVATSPSLGFVATTGFGGAFGVFSSGTAMTFQMQSGTVATGVLASPTHAAGRAVIGATRQSGGVASAFAACRVKDVIIINKALTSDDITNLKTYYGL